MRVRFRYATYAGGPTTEQQDLERLFHELWHVRQRTMLPAGEWRPPTDVYETADYVVVKMELAGVPEDSIEVTLYADHLVVSGTRDDGGGPAEAAIRSGGRVSFHEAGIHYGPFRAEVRLPRPVDPERVTATLESGFLLISLPRLAG
jgi:HSP20 family molecular chaperone IbpA